MRQSVINERKGDESPARARRSKVCKDPRVARTRTGLGVYAAQRYRRSQIIGEIEGEVIDDAVYTSRYCMDLGDTRCLEPAAPFRFVNHSCVPNCTFQWFDVDSTDERPAARRMFLMALAAIQSGDELTIDYCWPPHMAIRCRCGEKECRGWIVAENELADLHALQASV